MVTLELIEYIKTQLQAGADKAAIEKVLLENKWPAEDIKQAWVDLEVPKEVVAVVPEDLNLTPIAVNKSSVQLSLVPKKPFWKNYKFWLLTISVVIVLGLISGGVWAYLNIYQAPETAIVKSLEAFKNVKNITYQGQLEIKLGNKSSNNKTLSISIPAFEHLKSYNVTFNGLQDLSDIDNKKSLVKLDAVAKDENGQEAGGLGVEVRYLSQVLYVMIYKINLFQPGLDLSGVVNQWIKLDINNKKDDAVLGEMAGGLADTKSVDSLVGLKLSTTDWLNIAKAYYQTKPLNLKKLVNEKIEEDNVYHYSWQLDEIKFKEFIKQVYDNLPETIQSPELQQKFLTDLQKPLGGNLKGEFWIDANNNFLRRFTFKYIDSVDQDKTISAIVDMTYNTTVSIEEPSPFKTMGEILQSLLGEVMKKEDSNPMELSDTQDSDGDGLSDREESLLGTDINNPDTDGDGYSDKQEIDNGYNPLGSGKIELP